MSTASIGRAKTVIVSGHGEHAAAVVSSVIVRAYDDALDPRVRFTGPVAFHWSTAAHVLKVVAARMAEEYAQNGIASRVGHYLRSLTPDERFEATTEYLQKHGRLLPRELTEGGGGRVRANFTRVLEERPRILQQTRRASR